MKRLEILELSLESARIRSRPVSKYAELAHSMKQIDQEVKELTEWKMRHAWTFRQEPLVTPAHILVAHWIGQTRLSPHPLLTACLDHH